LVPGTRLGAYDIVSQIGAGGMGEVYRAHDTKLNRDVEPAPAEALATMLPTAAVSSEGRMVGFWAHTPCR
jgi:hypothetical protein